LGQSPLLRIWLRFRREKLAVGALAILAGLLLVAILAPVLAPYEPFAAHPEIALKPPTSGFPFGTDHLGRDVLSGVIWGARTSIGTSFASITLSTLIGIPIGAVAGYYGGRFDDLMMRIVDIFLVIPTFFIVLVVMAIFGAKQYLLVIILGLTMWPRTARLFRGAVLSVKEEAFVEAAVALGSSDSRVIGRHLVPNAIFPVIVNLPLQAGAVILIEAGLGFIGLGDPTIISWGSMLNDAQQMVYHSWWMPLFPGLAITTTILTFNLVGDGLNEAISSRYQQQ
jgi:peptide/nickel transport system permease protein